MDYDDGIPQCSIAIRTLVPSYTKGGDKENEDEAYEAKNEEEEDRQKDGLRGADDGPGQSWEVGQDGVGPGGVPQQMTQSISSLFPSGNLRPDVRARWAVSWRLHMWLMW